MIYEILISYRFRA